MRKQAQWKGFFACFFLFCTIFPLGAFHPTVGEASIPPAKPHDLNISFSDLDGDGINESVQAERLGVYEHISFTLSRNGVYTVLQFVPATSDLGVLSLQDADGDGDIDLLWRNPLHVSLNLVCLNNGDGQFECLAPPRASSAHQRASLTQFPFPCPERLCNPERSPSLEYKSSPQGSASLMPISTSVQQESLLGNVSFVSSLPSDRGPPISLR